MVERIIEGINGVKSLEMFEEQTFFPIHLATVSYLYRNTFKVRLLVSQEKY